MFNKKSKEVSAAPDKPVQAESAVAKFMPTDAEKTQLTLRRFEAVIAKQSQLLIIAQYKELQQAALAADAAFNKAIASLGTEAQSVIEAHGWKDVVMNPDTCEFFVSPRTPAQ
jgi:hypothetical protein